MGLFSKMIGKRFGAAKAAAAKLDRKDLVEACIAGAILVAYADGECETSELEALANVISADETFTPWAGEVGRLIDQYSNLMKAGVAIGKIKLMREIRDVKSSPQEAEEVMAIMVTIAEADGEIEHKEMLVLKEVGRALGVDPAAFFSGNVEVDTPDVKAH